MNNVTSHVNLTLCKYNLTGYYKTLRYTKTYVILKRNVMLKRYVY